MTKTYYSSVANNNYIDFKIPIDWIYMATVVNNWSEDVWSISSTSFPTKIIKTINHRETIHYFKAPIYRKKRFKK